MLQTSRTYASPRRLSLALVCGLTLICAAAAPIARAQNAQDRTSAAEAYDRGTAAYLSENFAAAARWFETADRLAPAAPALIQAVRAHQRAGHDLRAATLALRLSLQYADEPAAQEAATSILDAAAQQYVRVEVSCGGCTLDLDGTLLESPAFFVDPGGDHALVAHFATGEREMTVRGSAGDVMTPEFEAPLAIVDDEHDPGSDTPVEPSGLSPAFFITGLVLTAGAGAALAWSGLDANSDADAYEASIAAGDFATAEQQLAKGRDEERRTNILIGVTAGLGLTTGLLAAFTNWSGSADSERSPADEGARVTAAAIAPTLSGATVRLEGRF